MHSIVTRGNTYGSAVGVSAAVVAIEVLVDYGRHQQKAALKIRSNIPSKMSLLVPPRGSVTLTRSGPASVGNACADAQLLPGRRRKF